jgi:hypothetical protein
MTDTPLDLLTMNLTRAQLDSIAELDRLLPPALLLKAYGYRTETAEAAPRCAAPLERRDNIIPFPRHPHRSAADNQRTGAGE